MKSSPFLSYGVSTGFFIFLIADSNKYYFFRLKYYENANISPIFLNQS
jgi:hypothetical protein